MTMARLRAVWVAMALGGLAWGASGCCGAENKKATSMCAASGKNVDSCKACCKSVTGKESYSYSSGSGCKCF